MKRVKPKLKSRRLVESQCVEHIEHSSEHPRLHKRHVHITCDCKVESVKTSHIHYSQ